MRHVGGQVSRWSQAPLYVCAFDLSRWLAERAEERGAAPYRELLARAARESEELLVAVGLALTFPAPRARNLERADEAVVRIRLLLRLASELGALSPQRLRHVARELDTIGRMLGGWRRAGLRKRSTKTSNGTGVEARMATSASCAAARSGTKRRTVAPPTATGTSPGTGTTTSAFASPSPPERA